MDRDPDIACTHEILNHEPSAWLRTAIAERLAELAGTRGLPNMLGIIALNLNDARPGTREDRSCDRCRTYTPPGEVFYTSMHDQSPERLPWPWSTLLAGHQILVAYGLCSACVDLEHGHEIHAED